MDKNKYNHFLSGSISGIITKTVISPLERGKILFQLQGIGKDTKYNIFKTYNHIIKNEGLRSLYKGNLTNCLKVIPTYGLKFGFTDFFINYFKTDNKYNRITIFKAGLLSGFLQTTITYPLDLIRTRLSILENLGIRYKGIYNCGINTVRKEGIKSLYKGYNPAIFLGTTYVGLQMLFYNIYKNELFRNNKGLYVPLLCGSFTGISNTLFLYPLDIIKRRLQVNGINNKKKIYKNVRNCVNKIIYKEGLIGLYRGLSISLIKVIPSSALQFGLYELLLKKF